MGFIITKVILRPGPILILLLAAALARL